MARHERPVDPTAGPLQAFAYDLRKLRAEAGNPTYRVLARSAGYSATTLSEAAGGARLPTLEVLLAYVGACRGDPGDWRRRWYDTAAQLHPTENEHDGPERVAGGIPGRRETVSEQQSAEQQSAEQQGAAQQGAEEKKAEEKKDPESASHDDPPGGPERNAEPDSNPRWRRRAVLGTALAATLTVGVATAARLPRFGGAPATSPAAAPRCPSVPAGVVFTGTTYGGGAHVRGGASRDDSLLSTVPPHCTVGFTGFCVGEKVYDNTAGTPDVRWFTLAGGGVVSSAVIHGNPPRTLRPSGCPNGRAVPTALDFSVVVDAAGRGAVTLHASGRDLSVVGFSTSTGGGAATAGTRIWRQVALADVPDPAVGGKARIDAVAPAGGGEPVILVAAACLGGDSPTGIVEARQVHPADPGRAVRLTLDPAQRSAAATSACRYPGRG
ncbi:helix-turn-helix domain-containing protein [Plantactinospora sp. CA-290183]|uniref:helix-turn-helix domain-containing protein n=1 Tax=Plantactinospora sp. CA-290183 TaxID=3240006 RepID=UPI003D91A019